MGRIPWQNSSLFYMALYFLLVVVILVSLKKNKADENRGLNVFLKQCLERTDTGLVCQGVVCDEMSSCF